MQSQTKLLSLLILLAASGVLVLAASAEPTLSVSLHKDNGYGWSNDMAGLWTLKTQVSSDTVYVEFYLDDQLQQNLTAAPYNWQFNTNNYPTGEHTLKAVAYDNAGENATETLTKNFVEDNTSDIVVIAIAVVIAITVVAVAVSVYRIKKSKK